MVHDDFLRTRVVQSMSVALLGRASFSGGAATAALGAFLHCCVAFAIASVYVLASQRVPWLVRYAVPLGMGYGVAAYFVMNYLVLRMTRVGLGRFALGPLLNGVIGHALLVGLPVALWARWSASVM